MAITRSRSLPAALTLRAKIVLACEREPSNAVVAARLGVGPHTIGKWRKRFIADRIEGLYDEMRSGRPRTVGDEAVAELITKTLARKPKAATHWSVRAIAKETGITKSTVHRLFQLFGLQPHRTRSFKLSTDPFFVEKLRDVVGLYLNPPDKAVVLCVDEKSQIQALERTQPMLPMGFGYIEGVTHDYQRHGTTTLFAALNVLDGAVIAQCKSRHRHQEFLAFLRHIEINVPAQLDVHLVVDNYATHKHPKVRVGSHAVRVGTFHSRPPTPPGLTRSNASSLSSLNALSVAALSIPPPTSSKKSTASSALTMQILRHRSNHDASSPRRDRAPASSARPSPIPHHRQRSHPRIDLDHGPSFRAASQANSGAGNVPLTDWEDHQFRPLSGTLYCKRGAVTVQRPPLPVTASCCPDVMGGTAPSPHRHRISSLDRQMRATSST